MAAMPAPDGPAPPTGPPVMPAGPPSSPPSSQRPASHTPVPDLDATPTTRRGRAARNLLGRALGVAIALDDDRDPLELSIERIRGRVDDVLADQRLRLMAEVPLARLADLVDDTSLRTGAMRAAGVTSVRDVLAAADLTTIHGVGPKTARAVVGAAQQLASSMGDVAGLRLDPDDPTEPQRLLLAAVAHHLHLVNAVPQLQAHAEAVADQLRAAAALARPTADHLLRRLFRREDPRADAGLARVEQLMDEVERADLVGRRHRQLRAHDKVPAGQLWAMYETSPARVHALLEELTGIGPADDVVAGHLPSEIVEAVRAQPLDTALLNLSLRGYQAFGARYALHQRRTLIGDEMGLGKTIIALAVAGHLWQAGERRVLVVCPASVLLNWLREVDVHTHMQAIRVHGDGRDAALRRWQADGGVAITTFGTLRRLPGPLDADLLVVDEAHFVKNPATLRARAVTAWGDRATRVMYLTGTPLENRVSEFRELVGQLRPDLAAGLDVGFVAAGSDWFRRQVAPVYLRRNQSDVLTELPPLVEVDDWVEPTPADQAHYRRAVASGNFMAMRRAAWVDDNAAKLQRLREIVDESAEHGWKVLVFSFFLDTLDTIATGLDLPVFGPLTGATSPGDRLDLVDAYSAHDGPAVLVAQMTAGGVGLNIQAASVVVLAEPQWKPSTEDQAIARAHRMGQARRVTVHRLLATPGVDERMRELVGHKEQVFDQTVRHSVIAEVAPDAVDRTQRAMVEQILSEESRRLGLEPAGTG